MSFKVGDRIIVICKGEGICSDYFNGDIGKIISISDIKFPIVNFSTYSPKTGSMRTSYNVKDTEIMVLPESTVIDAIYN